ncbi:MAG: Cys-tRNA(Pro) deacylase [Desulfobulbaceae bacterium]|nr:Cys-tRNA(Pro) deacylase [Desulfobulbaceae bacterium]
MTPAITAAQQSGVSFVIHQFRHDPKSQSYALEAAEKLGRDRQQIYKTLIVQLDGGELAVAMLPAALTLSLKTLAKAAEARKATMAPPALAEKTTGYVVGGISPLGQKKRLRAFLHEAALEQSGILISAGRRGLEIELAPADLLRLTGAIATLLA